MARIVYTDMSGQERSVPFGTDAPVVSIGRATDCTIRSNRKSVSRRHAEFRFANEQFEVVDLNSSNGTYLIINEERKPVLGREYLAHNDEVWCGDFILRFFEEDSPTADHYPDDSTFNAGQQQPGNYPHMPTQPPAFGEPARPGFGGGGNNGQFGGQQAPGQNSWSPPAQPGPLFTNPNPPQNSFSSPPNSSFGAEPQFAEPAFQNDAVFGQEASFANEPSFANDPPNFGEPVRSPYDDASTQNQSGYDQNALDTSTQNHKDLAAFMQSQDAERLEQERDAYAELADRQKGEIDDLQSRLTELQEQFDGVRSEVESLRENEDATSVATPPAEVAKLRDNLVEARTRADELRVEADAAEAATAEARGAIVSLRQQLDQLLADTTAADLELEHLREENSTLEHELAATREAASEPSPALQAEIADLRDQLAGKERDVTALESEVDRLSGEMHALERGAAEQSKTDAQKTREETEALRRELERHKRLVEEFEKRNRELQAELDGAADGANEFEQRIEQDEAKRAELEGELEALAKDLETARNERDSATQTIAEIKAQGDIGDLRNEIEGLKHRLKMEKDRAGAGDARLTDEVERLNGQVSELDAQNADLRASLDAASVVGGATAEDLAVLREKVEALDRIVDAIVRTNLEPLSTVDRIRLQSAIRDTDPKATLAALLNLTSPE